MSEYQAKASSREKDLVDLVVIATTHDLDGSALRVAITTAARRREMEPLDHFVVPSTSGPGYTKLSKPVPYCTKCPTVLVVTLVARLIDPVLVGEADGMVWSHSELTWSR